jgi:hypothetical protein
MITLHVEPGQAPMTFEEFKTKVGGSAVALDGYVAEGPRVPFGAGGQFQPPRGGESSGDAGYLCAGAPGGSAGFFPAVYGDRACVRQRLR